MSDATRINGNLISWASLKVKLNGEPYSGITSIEYSDGRERAYAYGIGRHHAPRGMTAGKYTPEPCVITCWKSTAKAIREAVAKRAQDGRSYGSVTDNVLVVQYVEPTDAVITVEIQDAPITKIEASDEEGPEGLNEKITLAPMRIIRDGLTLYDSTEQGA